ncbi:MAG: hypothetical protein RLY21_1639 [Planctomycetota bacterium]|jgi:hypothetical protein
MRVWFKNIASLLGVEDAEERSLRQILTAAAARSAIVGLCKEEFDAYPDPECCILEGVEEDTLILVAVGPARMDLVVGASFHIAISSSRGFHRGETKIISRWVEQSDGGGGQRFGFRVSVPQTLTHIQRRVTHRVPVAFDLAPFVYLAVPEAEQPPCKAQIIDLSETGMRVRVPIEQDYAMGQMLDADARFTEVIPSFKAKCEVIRVTPVKNRHARIVGVRFDHTLSELAHAIRALDLRRSSRSSV